MAGTGRVGMYISRSESSCRYPRPKSHWVVSKRTGCFTCLIFPRTLMAVVVFVKAYVKKHMNVQEAEYLLNHFSREEMTSVDMFGLD